MTQNQPSALPMLEPFHLQLHSNTSTPQHQSTPSSPDPHPFHAHSPQRRSNKTLTIDPLNITELSVNTRDEENGLLNVSPGSEGEFNENDSLQPTSKSTKSHYYWSREKFSFTRCFYSNYSIAPSLLIHLALIAFLLWSHEQPSKCAVDTYSTNSIQTFPVVKSPAIAADATETVSLTDPLVVKPSPKTEETGTSTPVSLPIPTPSIPLVEPKSEPVVPVEVEKPPPVESEADPNDDLVIPQEPLPEVVPTQTPLLQTTPQPEPVAPSSTPPPSTPPAPVVTPPTPSDSQQLVSASSSVDTFQTSFDLTKDHKVTWTVCERDFALDPLTDYRHSGMGAPPSKFCPETLTNEQFYQLSWFGSHVAVGYTLPQRFVPKFLDCIHLPPNDYIWPEKYPTLPCTNPQGAIHWPNLRSQSFQDLIEFNRGTPKNLYHFDAPKYDLDGLDEMALAAKYIPFGKKIRNMFDIGAGGGSFGVLLKAKYDVQTISSAFADWPYCEYMTERGELCLLVDVMEPMPFAKFSFDLIHVSWVYHGQYPKELFTFTHEVDRLLRPGGYLYIRGGWSNSQIVAQRDFLSDLGYTLLYESVSHKPAVITAKISFGDNLPYHADWTAIYVKPIRHALAEPNVCKRRLHEQLTGVPMTPIPVRPFGTQMGNVYENVKETTPTPA